MTDEGPPFAPQRPRYFPGWAREIYRRDGWRVVEPGSPFGSTMGFHGKDWHPDSFLALGVNEVELPLLVARKPGEGAFTRLVERLHGDGYRVRGCRAPRAAGRSPVARWLVC